MVRVGLTGGQGQLREAWTWRVDLAARPRLAHHVTGDQVAVEDVPGGGDKAAAVTDPIQGIRVHLQVALTVCFSGEGGQADETDERTLPCGRKDGQKGTGC